MSGAGVGMEAGEGGAAEPRGQRARDLGLRDSGLRVADFDFELPEELIAQQPPEVRGASRMLVLDRGTGELRDSRFAELTAQLRAGDLVVLNDTRVIPARLYARRTTVREKQEATGLIEVLLTEPAGEGEWRALVRPGKKVGVGDRLAFADRLVERWSLRPRCWSAGSLGKGCCGSRRWGISSRCWSGLGICRCRHTFIGRMRAKIERGIRRCSRANVARWLRRRRGCILRKR